MHVARFKNFRILYVTLSHLKSKEKACVRLNLILHWLCNVNKTYAHQMCVHQIKTFHKSP